MSDKKEIIDFVENIPQKLDQTKSISLYKLIIKKCPNCLNQICKKIYGKYSWKEIHKERKWYTAIINYMVKTEVMMTEKIEGQTFHNVTEEYSKYFIIPKSSAYSLNNADEHIKLYAETATEFLKECGLLNQDGKEVIQEDEVKKQKKNKKAKKIINITASMGLLTTILYYIILAAKYGLKQYISILSVSCLFTIFVVILANDGKKD